jgi:hypothetical protein
MWKETVVNVRSLHLSGGTLEDLNYVSQLAGRDSSRTPPEYKTEANFLGPSRVLEPPHFRVRPQGLMMMMFKTVQCRNMPQ